MTLDSLRMQDGERSERSCFAIQLPKATLGLLRSRNVLQLQNGLSWIVQDAILGPAENAEKSEMEAHRGTSTGFPPFLTRARGCVQLA